jgi:hypothetical protein
LVVQLWLQIPLHNLFNPPSDLRFEVFLFLLGLLDGSQNIIVYTFPSSDDPKVLSQIPAKPKVEKFPSRVGDYTTCFRYEERAWSMVL